jgi:glutathione synthase/RimK-type ligase-like ATP-grasp enzyme
VAFLVVGSKPSRPTCSALADAARELGLESAALEPHRLGRTARVGDIVLGRLSVRASHAGVERGLDDLGRAVARGILVLNPPAALLAASDKLATALRLARAGVPQPRTALVGGGARPALEPPVVVKPRFATGGAGLAVCLDGRALEAYLDRLRGEHWFRRHGAVAQPLLRVERELRVLVAGGRAVGTVEPGAARLAVAAAAATDADVVAVDLVEADGSLLVLDLDPAPEVELPDVARTVVRLLLDDTRHALIA